jgi:hypothetical protein
MADLQQGGNAGPSIAAGALTRPELNEDFVELLRALVDAGVEFVIVGAHALAAHGLPCATGDLDVLVRPSVDAPSWASSSRGCACSSWGSTLS